MSDLQSQSYSKGLRSVGLSLHELEQALTTTLPPKHYRFLAYELGDLVVNPISVNRALESRITMSPKPKEGMKRLDVYLPEADEQLFRGEVFKRKGMKKGNISEAVNEAIQLWIDTPVRKVKGQRT